PTLVRHLLLSYLFSFNATPTTHIYTLSLHDALPISARTTCRRWPRRVLWAALAGVAIVGMLFALLAAFGDQATGPIVMSQDSAKDRKSTRLNSSHDQISYAVFCLKKKKKIN